MQNTLPKVPAHAEPLTDGQIEYAFVGVNKIQIQCVSLPRSIYRVFVTRGGFQVPGLENTYNNEAAAQQAYANAQVKLAAAPALGAEPAPAATEPALPEPALKVLVAGVAAEGGVVDSLGGIAPESFQVPIDQKLVEPVEGVKVIRREYGVSARISSVRVVVRLTPKGAERVARELARLAGSPADSAKYQRVCVFLDRSREANRNAAPASRVLVNA